ncbi:hypothetical protein GCM10023195_60680 [Actinoallomurus liliacearum]|uniref:YcxB-like C-terminal domain-containing protein n=1 Tax=Actinoallomurus liliacearum TaxID=1080073 RepID=A0ABP8TQG7_9ACTN
MFTLSYVPTVEDIAELVADSVQKSRRAASKGIITALMPVGIVLIAVLTRMDGSGPVPDGELIGWMLGWSCAIIWVNGKRLRSLSPLRVAHRQRARHSEVRTPYEVELSDEGLTSRTDELTMKMPWSYFAQVEETKRQFILKRPSGEASFALPKHGLPEAARIDALRDFLHTHITQSR